MKIEEEIFKKSNIDFSKLIKYGFQKEDDKYYISKYILNNNFKIEIVIDKVGVIKGKIIDTKINEEYLNYRIDSEVGKFVSSIREEYIFFLNDIKEKCTNTNDFISSQANRIAKLIKDKYHNIPEFLWDDDKNAVFRNSDNKKWYGIIMQVGKEKITKGKGTIEIINVKLAKDKIKELLKKKNFYKAYHMNKECWLTIILDDSISDAEIMNYIDESYNFTIKKVKK